MFCWILKVKLHLPVDGTRTLNLGKLEINIDEKKLLFTAIHIIRIQEGIELVKSMFTHIGGHNQSPACVKG